jgi:hypothetical protein
MQIPFIEKMVFLINQRAKEIIGEKPSKLILRSPKSTATQN